MWNETEALLGADEMLRTSDTIVTLGSAPASPLSSSDSPAVISSITTSPVHMNRQKVNSKSSNFLFWCRKVRQAPRSFSTKRNSLLWEDCSSDEYESFNSDDISPGYQRRRSRRSFSSTPKTGSRSSRGSLKGSIKGSIKGSATVYYSSKGHSVTIRENDVPQISSSVLQDNTLSTVSGYSPSWLFQEQYSPTGLPQEKEIVTSLVEKIFRTFLLCAANFVLAMTFSLLGLTLLDLGDHLNVSLTEITQLITSSSLGGIFGALFMGIVLDYVNDSVAIYTSLFIIAVFLFVTPLVMSYVGLLFVTFAKGIILSFLHCASSVVCVFIWGSCHAPYMLLVHLSFGLGSIFTPLITQPFLSKTLDAFKVNHGVNEAFGSCVNSSSRSSFQAFPSHGYSISHDICGLYNETLTQKKDDLTEMTLTFTNDDVIRLDPPHATSYQTNISQSEALFLHGMELKDLCAELSTQTTFQGAYNLVASLCLVLGVAYFILWLVKERNILVRRLNKNLGETFTENHESQADSMPLLTILAIYAFIQAGCETAYSNYLFTFFAEGIGLSKAKSSHMLSVHWTSRVAGYVIGTLTTSTVPTIALVCGSIMMTIAFLLLQTLAGACNAAVMLACVFFIGFGQSLLTPAILSWLDTKTTVSHRASSVVMLLNHVGALVVSAVTGLVLTYEPSYFNVVIVVSYSLCLVLFVNMAVMTYYKGMVTSPLLIDANANMAKEADRQVCRTPKRTTLRHGSMLYAPHLRPRFSVVSTTAEASHSQLLRIACITLRPAPISLRAVTKFAFNYESESL